MSRPISSYVDLSDFDSLELMICHMIDYADVRGFDIIEYKSFCKVFAKKYRSTYNRLISWKYLYNNHERINNYMSKRNLPFKISCDMSTGMDLYYLEILNNSKYDKSITKRYDTKYTDIYWVYELRDLLDDYSLMGEMKREKYLKFLQEVFYCSKSLANGPASWKSLFILRYINNLFISYAKEYEVQMNKEHHTWKVVKK